MMVNLFKAHQRHVRLPLATGVKPVSRTDPRVGRTRECSVTVRYYRIEYSVLEYENASKYFSLARFSAFESRLLRSSQR